MAFLQWHFPNEEPEAQNGCTITSRKITDLGFKLISACVQSSTFESLCGTEIKKKKIILFLTFYCKCNGVREGDPIFKETK